MHDDDDALTALPWKTVEKRNQRRHGPNWMHDGERPQAGVAETLKTGSQRQATPKMGLEPQTITGKVPSRH